MSGPTPGAVTAEHRDALRALSVALVAVDGHTPCAGDKRFIDDRHAVVTEAAQECAGCPVKAECAAVGEYEKHGVYGGIVRGGDRPAGRKRKPERKSA